MELLKLQRFFCGSVYNRNLPLPSELQYFFSLKKTLHKKELAVYRSLLSPHCLLELPFTGT